jgi:serine/threonine-protein kinase
MTPDEAMGDVARASSETPRVIAGTYQLLERLGGGAMGQVYAAEHLRTGRQVALKILRGDLGEDARALKRFEREARALASIDSAYVVSILDCGRSEAGAPYLVMERLVGEDLRRLLDRSGRLPLRRALYLALDACRGLRAVHAAGLVHRDLKPANLFVTRRDNGEELCKILDFGVAKHAASSATREGTVIGTIRYMAPEQLTDGSNAGPRCDVYAIGAILYECVTGVAPHSGDTVQELMFDIVNHDVPSAAKYMSGLPPELGRIFERTLARDPSRRFAGADALLSALEALLPGGAQSGSDLDPTGTYDLPPQEHQDASRSVRLSRSSALVASLGLVLASLAVGFALGDTVRGRRGQHDFAAHGLEGLPAHFPESTSSAARTVNRTPAEGSPQPGVVPTSSAPKPAPARDSRRPSRPRTQAVFIPSPATQPTEGQVRDPAPQPTPQFITEASPPSPRQGSPTPSRNDSSNDEAVYFGRE